MSREVAIFDLDSALLRSSPLPVLSAALNDVDPARGRVASATDDYIRKWSCLTALETGTLNLPPLLLVRAGRDSPALLEGTDTFVRRARERGVDLTVLDHPTGQHGFDTVDNDDRSREIIGAALDFFVRHLSR